MKRKKLLIGISALILAAFTVKGIIHARMTAEKKVSLITEKMTKKLDLTPEQKVYQINHARYNGHKMAYNAKRRKQ